MDMRQLLEPFLYGRVASEGLNAYSKRIMCFYRRGVSLLLSELDQGSVHSISGVLDSCGILLLRIRIGALLEHRCCRQSISSIRCLGAS